MLNDFNESAQANYEKLGAQKLSQHERAIGRTVLSLIEDDADELPSILLGLAAALDQLKANHIWAPTAQIRLGTAISSLVVAAKAE